VEAYLLELGGSANIFASQFVKLGGKAGVIGWTGEDPLGELVMKRLSELGIDTSRVRPHPKFKTGLGLALTEPDDRAILTYLGTIDSVTPADLDAGDLFTCRHWHIASYFLLTRLRPFWPEWLRTCRRQGVTTSLDTNWDPADQWTGVRDLLPHLDLFFPNEAEALAVSGAPTVAAAGEELARLGPLVVIKRGAKGATAFQGERRWVSPPLPVPDGTVVDAIGAGDNFDAGFLRAWLLQHPLEECLELGQRCAVRSLGATGGFEGQLVSGL